MLIRPRRVCFPVVLSLFMVAGGLPAQEPTAEKAAPERLVITSTVPEAKVVVEKGMFELENGAVNRAVPQFRRALELDPTLGLVRALHVYLSGSLHAAERAREMDRAVADAARATTPELLLATSLREWVRGNRKASILIMRAARMLVPEDPFVTAMEVGSMFQAGAPPADWLPTIQSFLERHPEEAAFYNLQAYGLAQAGKQAESLAAIEKYVQMMPDHPNSHDSYGELLQKAGRFDDAEREYKRAMALDPGWGLGRLITLAQVRHDYNGAAVYLDTLLARATTPASRINVLWREGFNAVMAGDLKLMHVRFQAAIAEANKAGLTEQASSTNAGLAALEAAAGNAGAARRALAAAVATPTPLAGIWGAFVHGPLGDAAAVQHDVEVATQAAAATPASPPWALPLTRLIAASMKGDVAAAREELGRIKNPYYAVTGQAFLLLAAKRAGDNDTMKEAQAAIDAYTTVDGSSAYVHLLLGRK